MIRIVWIICATFPQLSGLWHLLAGIGGSHWPAEKERAMMWMLGADPRLLLFAGGGWCVQSWSWFDFGDAHMGCSCDFIKPHERADLQGSEKIQLPRGYSWVVCREGNNKWSLCQCSGRIFVLQTHWRSCSNEGLLWCIAEVKDVKW